MIEETAVYNGTTYRLRVLGHCFYGPHRIARPVHAWWECEFTAVAGDEPRWLPYGVDGDTAADAMQALKLIIVTVEHSDVGLWQRLL